MPTIYPKTDILVPYKEMMTDHNAGAIAQIIRDLACLSQHPKAITIFGCPLVHEPMNEISYRPLKATHTWLHGRNIGFANAYLKHIGKHGAPDLIEIHGRCQVARTICTSRPDLAVSLYLHNDPRQMKAGKSVADRLWLAHKMSAIIFVSAYLKSCFLEGLPDEQAFLKKLHIVPNGVRRHHTNPPKKTKTLLIAGRMVPEKGIIQACEAAALVMPRYLDWQLHIVGSRHFKPARLSNYEKKIRQVLAPLGGQAVHHGFLPAKALAEIQSRAAISLVPSLWQEPAGLTVLEALASASALITTDRGGILETATGRAEIVRVEDLVSNHLEKNLIASPANNLEIIARFATALEALLSDPTRLTNLQETAWADYPFDSRQMAENADKYRYSLMS